MQQKLTSDQFKYAHTLFERQFAKDSISDQEISLSDQEISLSDQEISLAVSRFINVEFHHVANKGAFRVR
jgi:hypothetical protein